VLGQVRVPDRRADLQAAIGHCLDRGEGQPVDVDEPRGGLDVQLHQVEQGGPAGEEPHVRALLRGPRLRGYPDRRRGIFRPYELKGMHVTV